VLFWLPFPTIAVVPLMATLKPKLTEVAPSGAVTSCCAPLTV